MKIDFIDDLIIWTLNNKLKMSGLRIVLFGLFITVFGILVFLYLTPSVKRPTISDLTFPVKVWDRDLEGKEVGIIQKDTFYVPAELQLADEVFENLANSPTSCDKIIWRSEGFNTERLDLYIVLDEDGTIPRYPMIYLVDSSSSLSFPLGYTWVILTLILVFSLAYLWLKR